MNYDDFLAHAERCKKIWQAFKDSFSDPGLRAFLKHSYPVLSYARGQISLGSLDARTIAMESPHSFVPNKASEVLIRRIRQLEGLKKDAADRDKEKRAVIEKKLSEFRFQRLQLEEHRLEVRFPALNISLIQEIKKSPQVDPELTGLSSTSIRVVLRTR